jgi:signal transduction histidine kinase
MSANDDRDEAARLASLRELLILDSEPESEFDNLVRAAALVCDTPISLVSLVDSDRQWFKARFGLEGVQETARDLAFCAHTIQQPTTLEVSDATQDARFRDNALVTQAPGIRFYAGVPLELSSGFRVGTLCVIDRRPRELTAKQREILEHLAKAAALALERRRDSRQLAAATRQLEEVSAQLRDQSGRKNHFLAALGHEMRGPLSAMRTAMEILKLEGGPSARVSAALGILGRQFDQLANLTESLMDVASIDSGKVTLLRSRVDLNALVGLALEMSQSLIDSRQHVLERNLFPGPIFLMGDSARLVQAISNLITNAAKYTPVRGRISVTTHVDGEQGVVVVRDNGLGIAPNRLPSVFEMFEQDADQGKYQEGGLGIGLTIVKQLIELHGGTVAARSEGTNRGSEFELRLPRGWLPD